MQYWGPLLWPSNWENGSIEIAVGSHHLGHIADLKIEQRAVGAQQYLVPEERSSGASRRNSSRSDPETSSCSPATSCTGRRIRAVKLA